MEIFKLFGSIFVDTDEAEKSISSTDEKATSFARKLGDGIKTAAKWGAGVAAAAGAASVALGTKAVGAAMDFEAQMANVATLLDGDVDARIAELGETVKQVSTDTGTSTELLTDGLYQVISALGDSADSMKVLETAAKGAKAGNATVTDSVNLLAAVTKGYGDTSAEAAQKASDLAFNTVKLGQTSFPELASSMGKVIPLASAMCVSQEELFGAMATLTGVTGSTSEVTTQLKATIQGLMSPTKSMAETISNLGYESGQAMIQELGMQGTLEALKESVEGNDLALAGLFSSTEAQTAVLALAGSQAENFTEKTQAMYEAVGATDAAFETQTDNTQANIEKMKNSFNVLLTTLGEQLLPLVNKVLDWFNDKMPVIQRVVEVTFDAIGVAVDFIGGIFESFTTDSGNLFDQFTDGLRVAWYTYGQPLFEAIQQIIDTLKENWETVFESIRTLFVVVMDYLKTAWENVGKPVFDLIVDIIEIVAGKFQEYMPQIVEFFQQMVGDIKNIWENNLKPVFEAIKNIIENYLAPAFKYVFEVVIGPVVDGVFNGIKDLWNNSLKPVFEGITEFLKNVFAGDWKAAWESIVKIVDGIFSGIVTVVKTPINAVIKIINSFISGLNKISVPDWVPLIGGKGINIPTIPLLAKGGHITSEGSAIVGEAGAELIDLPVGAKVTPLKGNGSVLDNTEVVNTLNTMIDLLKKYFPDFAKEKKVYLDRKIISSTVSQELGLMM